MICYKKIAHDRLATLNPFLLHIDDQSAKHAGHKGVQGVTHPQTHFAITIGTDQFADLALLKRHRLLHQTLGDVTTHIHSLTFKTFAYPQDVPQKYTHLINQDVSL
jgi:BolA protein